MMMMMNVEQIAIKQQKLFPVTISKDTPTSLRFDRCYPLNSTTKEYLEVKKNCFKTFSKLMQDISTANENNWRAKCQNCENEMVF